MPCIVYGMNSMQAESSAGVFGLMGQACSSWFGFGSGDSNSLKQVEDVIKQEDQNLVAVMIASAQSFHNAQATLEFAMHQIPSLQQQWADEKTAIIAGCSAKLSAIEKVMATCQERKKAAIEEQVQKLADLKTAKKEAKKELIDLIAKVKWEKRQYNLEYPENPIQDRIFTLGAACNPEGQTLEDLRLRYTKFRDAVANPTTKRGLTKDYPSMAVTAGKRTDEPVIVNDPWIAAFEELEALKKLEALKESKELV